MSDRTGNPLVEAGSLGDEEQQYELSLRPRRLREYIGQHKVTDNLDIFIRAALRRSEALDHVLLHGPPGLGKTTLATIVANEMGADLKSTSGPVIEKSGDLAAILTNLKENDVLFIDEIHRLNPAIEEVLYPAMEDFQLDLIIGEGPAARSVRIDLSPFTLIAATTRSGMIAKPLHDRNEPQQLLRFTAAREHDHRITRDQHAEVAVNGFDRVHEHRRSAGRRKRRRDLLADDARLSDAAREDAAAATSDRLDCGRERPVNPIDEVANRGRFDLENEAGTVDREPHCFTVVHGHRRK